MPRRVDSNRGSFDGSVKTAVRRPTDRTSDRAENIMSNSAYIFDAIRTPRGKGKKDGALHEVKPVLLAAGLLREMQRRHDLDTSRVDDVVLGCVSPVGEQGGDIAKTVVQTAGWNESVAGVQIDRFCASGL